jgi:hypothetical protein
MFAMHLWRSVLVLGPIIALLTIGSYLTLQSGVVRLSSGQGARRLVGNLSQMVVLLTGCLFGLALIQMLVGFDLGLM